MWEVEQQQLAKVRSLADKWREVSRRIELWVDIQVRPRLADHFFYMCEIIPVNIRRN